MTTETLIPKVLNDAADLVTQGWTQNTLAVSKSGFTVGPASNAAVKWCAGGAIIRAAQSNAKTKSQFGKLRDAAYLRMIGFLSLPASAWNDDPKRKKFQVVKALREAARVSQLSNI